MEKQMKEAQEKRKEAGLKALALSFDLMAELDEDTRDHLVNHLNDLAQMCEDIGENEAAAQAKLAAAYLSGK
jgi:hypothetical protein